MTPVHIGGERWFAFFVHPAAADGKAMRRLERAVACAPQWKETRRPLAQRSRVVETHSFAETCEGLRSLADHEIPVAAGGDGALHYLVRALRSEGLGLRPVGVLPLGTGNALAYTIGLGSLGEAIRVLDAGQVRALDLMVTTHPEATVVVASLSLGFEAEFIRSWSRVRRSGRWPGGLMALAHAATTRGTTGQMWLDGGTSLWTGSRVWSAGLYNISRYAFGKLAIPQCDPGDGTAEAIVYRDAWAYTRGLATGNGSVSHGVERCRWREAIVETSGPIQADGESIAGCSLTVHLEVGGLQVIAT